jgi:GNAT superfamily N-acetyltransferase
MDTRPQRPGGYGGSMVELRRGTPGDEQALLDLFDEAVRWLVERGQPEQWGSDPWSGSERHREFVADLARHEGFFVAEEDDEVVGALVTGEPMPYAPAPREPEVYVRLLVTSRRHRGRDIGGLLVERARQIARDAGVSLLRVDCYAAPTLVAWYERQGFVAVERVPVGTVEVCILEQRVSSTAKTY